MPLPAQGSRSWICIPAFLGNFGCFPRDLGMSGSLRWDPGIPGSWIPGQEQLPGGKITWKSHFSLLLRSFPWLGRKNKVEKPFFPGFWRDFSMDLVSRQFPGGKITWKSRFSLVWAGLELVPPAPARVWDGFGNIWNQNPGRGVLALFLSPGMSGNCSKVGFSPKSPFWIPGAGMGEIFLGGKIPNPRLWSSWEPGMNPVNWIPVINWIPIVPGRPEPWKTREWGKLGEEETPSIWGKSRENPDFDPKLNQPRVPRERREPKSLRGFFYPKKKKEKIPGKGENRSKKIPPAPLFPFSHFQLLPAFPFLGKSPVSVINCNIFF